MSIIFIALLAVLFLKVVVLGTFFVLAMGEYDDAASDVQVGAPAASFDERRSWGVETFGENFSKVESWVCDSEQIRADVGEVKSVAPVGAPNGLQYYFGDPASTRMNLEVVGEKGKGILYLPEVYFENPGVGMGGNIRRIDRESSWTFSKQTSKIAFDSTRIESWEPGVSW